MSNVLHFGGAMHPRRALPQPKLTEADIDAQIAANREHHDEQIEAVLALAEARRAVRQLRPVPSVPSVIPLDSGLIARALRALRWLRLRGARV